jgi:hypothetical protein
MLGNAALGEDTGNTPGLAVASLVVFGKVDEGRSQLPVHQPSTDQRIGLREKQLAYESGF